MSRGISGKDWENAGLALGLAAVGGFVDAVGYLVLFQLFTGHMSGNTIAMGVHLGEQDWGTALYRAFPIPLFVAGVALGATVAECLIRCGSRWVFAPVLGLEIFLLLLFMIYGEPLVHPGLLRTESPATFYVLAALPPLAIGMQNATLRRVGGSQVRTTYISGMLTNLAENAVHFLFWLTRGLRRRRQGLSVLLRLAPRQPSFNRTLLFLAIWTVYALGGILGTMAELRWELLSLTAPVAGLTVLAVVDLCKPIRPAKSREGGRRQE